MYLKFWKIVILTFYCSNIIPMHNLFVTKINLNMLFIINNNNNIPINLHLKFEKNKIYHKPLGNIVSISTIS